MTLFQRLASTLVSLGCFAPVLRGQTSLEWIAFHGSGPTPVADAARVLAVDAAGNVHVALFSDNPSGFSDVDIAKYSASGVLQWSRRFDAGVSAEDEPRGIALASNGDVCVCGNSLSNQYDLFVVRYDAFGTLIFSDVFSGAPGSGEDMALSLAVDSQDNLVIAGRATAASGQTDMLVKAYSPVGTPLWDRRVDGPAGLFDSAMAISIDPGGDIFVAGQVGTANGSPDAAIAKLDSSGVLQWLSVWPGSGPYSDYFQTLGSDHQGGVVAGGSKAISVTFSTFPGGLVVRCDSTGTYLWADAYPQGITFNWTQSVAMDESGIAWALHATDTLGSNPRALLSRISPSGVRLSSQFVPSSSFPAGLVAGNVGQMFACSLAGPFASGPANYAVLTQFDSSGALNWERDFALSASGVIPYGLAPAPNARVVLHGVAAFGSSVSDWEGLVMQIDLSESPHGYCTAKINSLGCAPRSSFTGTARASVNAGFQVRIERVRNQKPGLFLYGVNGALGTPFGGGTLCINPPIRRTSGVQSGGGPASTQDCSGVFSIDMNAFAHGALGGSPAPELLNPGTQVWIQAWGRDNGFAPPNNVSLSGGLSYAILP